MNSALSVFLSSVAGCYMSVSILLPPSSSPPSPSSLHSLFSETLLCLCVAVADTVQWLSVAGCQQGQRTGCPALCCTIISVPTRCAPFWLCCFSLFVSLFQLRCYWHGSNEKTELCKLTLKDEGILKRPESLWKSSIKCGTNLPPRYCNEWFKKVISLVWLLLVYFRISGSCSDSLVIQTMCHI